MSTWIYDKSINPLDYFGFIYEITNLATGQKYIGKKRLFILKAKKIHKESDWKTYWGSCKELLEEIEQDIYGEEHYTRRVLHWCVSPGEMSYLEEKELFLRDALVAVLPSGLPAYYNGTIGHRHSKTAVIGYTETTRRAKWLKTIAAQKTKAGL